MLHHCYDADMISERHRHRYEFNNDYRRQLQECGLTLGGTSPDGRQMLVYINADTGKEEQILLLEISENGTLTV